MAVWGNREIIDAMIDGVIVFDPGYRVVSTNQAFLRMFGLKEKDVIGKNVMEIPGVEDQKQEDQKSFLPILNESFEKGFFGPFEMIITTQDKRKIPVSIAGGITKAASGRPNHIVAVVRDITERIQAEEALRESEEKYRNLVRLSPDPIVILQDGRHRLFSSAFTELFGYTQQDIDNGLGVLDVIQEDYKEAVLKRLEDRFAGKEVQKSLRVDMVAKDGRIIPCESSGALIQYGGRPAALVVIRDITERIQAEKALEKAYSDLQREMDERKRLEKALMQEEKLKTLGAVSAEVAHEIRNPLVSIGGFAHRLKQKMPDLPECDIILRESQRLEKILSRIESYLEPVELHQTECSVNTIITDSLNRISPEMEARQVACISDLAPRLPPAYVDPEILVQIFINLIRNATETMDKGGVLFVKTFASDREIHIEFKNQASGLKVKYPETLFMPFAEGGQTFGLPLCYRLLKDMGGLLSFTQDNDCIVFTVSLPTTAEPSREGKDS